MNTFIATIYVNSHRDLTLTNLCNFRVLLFAMYTVNIDMRWRWTQRLALTVIALAAGINADGDYRSLLNVPNAFKPSKNKVIGHIDILDEMHIEMDVLIHSFPGGWASVFHCTPGDNYPRVPGIWLHPNSKSGMGFHLKFSNNGGTNYGPDTGGNFVAGETYHVEIDITQGTHKVTINGEVKVNQNVQHHAKYSNVKCYAGDPWYAAADVTLSNIIISNRKSLGMSNSLQIANLKETVDDLVQKVEDMDDDYSLQLSVTEAFKPTKNKVIGRIDVLDEMYIAMDVTINSFPGDWASVFHCTPGDNYPRVPGIWLHPNSKSGMGFHLKFSNNGGSNYGPDTGGNFVVGETYHVEIEITQGTHKVTINGEVKVNQNVQAHATYQDIVCYAGDPWYVLDTYLLHFQTI